MVHAPSQISSVTLYSCDSHSILLVYIDVPLDKIIQSLLLLSYHLTSNHTNHPLQVRCRVPCGSIEYTTCSTTISASVLYDCEGKKKGNPRTDDQVPGSSPYAKGKTIVANLKAFGVISPGVGENPFRRAPLHLRWGFTLQRHSHSLSLLGRGPPCLLGWPIPGPGC